MATLPTEVTLPGVVLPSGSVIVTRSPALTSDCRSGSSATLTVRAVELADSTGPAAGAPRPACSVVTRAAVGRNTTSPSASSPVWSTPRWSLQLLHPGPGGPAELIPGRVHISTVDIAQRDQIVVQLRHVRPGHVRAVAPSARVR